MTLGRYHTIYQMASLPLRNLRSESKSPYIRVHADNLTSWRDQGPNWAWIRTLLGYQELELASLGEYVCIPVFKHCYITYNSNWLYDNAQHLQLYVDAYLMTESFFFDEIARDIAEYLTRASMASLLGGFYSSEDADSCPTTIGIRKREGAFYVWTIDEFTEEQVEVCASFWNMKLEGNIDQQCDVQGECKGKNVLYVSFKLLELATKHKKSEKAVKNMIYNGRQRLLAYTDAKHP